MPTPQQVREAIRESVAPIREQYRQIEQEITVHEDALVELRKLRTQTMRLLASAGVPEFVQPSKSPKTRPAKRVDGSYPISEQKLEAVQGYIGEHFDEQSSFHAHDLSLEELGMSNATRGAALRVLHERGVLRVDRQGPGGAKFYALSRAAQE